MIYIYLLSFILMGLNSFSYDNIAAHDYCSALFSSYPSQIQFCNGLQAELKNRKVIRFQKDPAVSQIEKMMENPTVQGLFHYDYWKFSTRQDAGRVRIYSLLDQVYGKNEHEIKKNLTRVQFLKQRVLFNKKNKAAESLQRVSKELSDLLKVKPGLAKYIYPADTYYYRKISKTTLLSAHSYGIAIDLSPNRTQYWQRDKNWKTISQIQYPMEIVHVFEKHGFIWGGRWFHYDSMHFEYRPEFLQMKKIRQKP